MSVAQRYKSVFGIFAWLALGAAMAAIVARSLVAGRLWNVRYDMFYGQSGPGFVPFGLAALCLLLSVVAFVVGLAAVVVRPRGWYLILIVGLATTVVAFRGAGSGLSDSDIKRIAAAGNRVVGAIEHYKKDKGKYPSKLSDLTPRYLPAIPKTGLSSERQFYYMRRGSSEEGWSLEASLTKSLMGSEPYVVTVMLIPQGTIVYRPSGDYRDIEGHPIGGGWAVTSRD